MENDLIKNCLIPASAGDAEGKLSVPSVFDFFMDLAAEHAASLGVGYHDMLRQGCFWVAVRTRAKLYRRPDTGSRITAETWPGKPGLAKSERYYRLSVDGGIVAEGRTEWTAQDIRTGAIRRTDSYGWPEIATRAERVCAEPFTRFLPFTDGETFTASVSSMDIDTGKHMNNVAYIRLLLSAFSTTELSAMDISELEISYRRACFEGEKLLVRRRREGGVWLFQVEKPSCEIAVQALLRSRNT